MAGSLKKETFHFTQNVIAIQPYVHLNGTTGHAWFDDLAIVPSYSSTSNLSSFTSKNDLHSKKTDGSTLGTSSILNESPLLPLNTLSENAAGNHNPYSSYSDLKSDFSLLILTQENEYIVNCTYSDTFNIQDGDDFDVEYDNTEALEQSLLILFGDTIEKVEVIEN